MPNYQDLVANHSALLIEKLVTHIVSDDHVDIRFEFLDDDQWSIITMHEYEEDLELSIRLHLNDVYDLYVGYYDEDDEFLEIIKPLNTDEKDLLPPSLKRGMKKVLDDEQGLRIPSQLISAKGR